MSPIVRAARPIEVPPSFREVYRSHYTFVWRSLMRLGVHEAAVDDAVQDVFIVVHRKLDAFEGRAAVRTWLFAIARRIALRYRDRARRAAMDDAPEVEPPASTGHPDTALSCNETLRKLQSWLDELDEDKRSVFVLSEFEQLRAPEIATMLAVNLNTVYARLRAARQHVSRRARREANMESYRSTVRTLSEARPEPGAQRRTWGLLIANVGVGTKAAVVTSGVSISASAASILSKVAVAAAVVGGGSMAVAAVQADPQPGAEKAPVIAAAQPAAVDPAAAPSSREPAPAARLAPAEPPPVFAPADSVRLAPSAAAILSPAMLAPKRSKAAAPAAAQPEPFAAELESFEQAKVAARRGDIREALDRIDRYSREFPRGTFAVEAAALRIRTLCKGQQTVQARKAAAEFGRTFGDSKLIDVDAPCG